VYRFGIDAVDQFLGICARKWGIPLLFRSLISFELHKEMGGSWGLELAKCWQARSPSNRKSTPGAIFSVGSTTIF